MAEGGWGCVEKRFVFDVREAPDRVLWLVERSLEEAGFSVKAGRFFDVSARRGAERVFVGVAPHEVGVVARVRGQAIVPGKAEALVDRVGTWLVEGLGAPVRVGGGGRG